MVPLMNTPILLSLLMHMANSAKVFNYPEFGTPPQKSMMNFVAYNSATNEILAYGGRSEEKVLDTELAAFNVKTKTWRHLLASFKENSSNFLASF